MRDPQLIALPYHNGLPDVGMAAGVRALLTELGRPADVVPPMDPGLPEVRRTLELDQRLAERVRAAVAAGAFPLVLAGNCNSCLGTVGGVGADGLGVVWFDAHADFDTPEDNVSGFFDVMALSTLTGSAWQAQRATVTAPVDEADVVLAAVRDLEPYQRARMEGSRLRVVPGDLDAPGGGAGCPAHAARLPAPRPRRARCRRGSGQRLRRRRRPDARALPGGRRRGLRPLRGRRRGADLLRPGGRC